MVQNHTMYGRQGVRSSGGMVVKEYGRQGVWSLGVWSLEACSSGGMVGHQGVWSSGGMVIRGYGR